MKVAKILVIGTLVTLFFAGFFTALAAAEGTSFDDAKVISEGTFSGTVTSDYYYAVNIPAHKAILVTLEAGNNSDVALTIYTADKQQAGMSGTASASDGAIDQAFYDGKSNTTYKVYIKIENMNMFTPSNYTITVKFLPSDMMSAATQINNGQKVSGNLVYIDEAVWYKIDVPKGEILNVSFSSSGGKVMVDLYDSQGNIIDSSSGTQGFVNTKLLGQSGTIYIRITSGEIQNSNITYTITPKLTKGSSTVEEVGTAITTTCLIGIIIGIAIIILIIVAIVKLIRRKK